MICSEERCERTVKCSGLCSACYQRRWKAGTLPKRKLKRDGSPHVCTVHGPSRACYSAHGCRCDGCRDSNVTYENRRVRQAAYGRPTMVDAEPVRRHVLLLSGQGLGKRRLADLTGLSITAIDKVKGQSKRVRKDTADRILAVEAWQAERTPTGLARVGRNSRCVDCSAAPLFGGLRCLSCFQLRARVRAGEHVGSERPSLSTYAAGCRCRHCKQASADYQRARRAAA